MESHYAPINYWPHHPRGEGQEFDNDSDQLPHPLARWGYQIPTHNPSSLQGIMWGFDYLKNSYIFTKLFQGKDPILHTWVTFFAQNQGKSCLPYISPKG